MTSEGDTHVLKSPIGGVFNSFGALRLLSPGTCRFENTLLTPLSRFRFVDSRRLMGLTNSHCDLHCVALMGPCAINDL